MIMKNKLLFALNLLPVRSFKNGPEVGLEE